MTNPIHPDRIYQLGLGFWASKTVLSAIELGLFSALAERSRSSAELEVELGIHSRASRDFLDALVALGLLLRDGDGAGAKYANAPDVDFFLDRAKPSYLGGFFEMANQRLYRVWGHLTEALRTGRPQNGIASGEESGFEALYADPEALEGFVRAMGSAAAGPSMALADKFDFGRYRTMVDAGGASAVLSVAVARRHPHLRVTSLDLPQVEPIARKAIAEAGLEGRVTAASTNFFVEPLPKADVVTMGHILHDWDLPRKKKLMRTAFDALPPGGAFIAVESIIDDARRENVFGLLMSLNMLVENDGGFDFTGSDFAHWSREVGFRRVEILPLGGPQYAAIAFK